MPALNFKKQFAEIVEQGFKTQTIRKQRKRGAIGVGDTITLYTGQRSPKCRKLGTGRCISSEAIVIETRYYVYLESKYLNVEKIEKLALDDGFSDWDEFFDFFEKTYHDPYPFHGVLIKWRLL